MKLNFNVDNEFIKGISRLSSILGYELGEGVNVTAERSDKIGVSYDGKNAVIYYKNKHHFYRELGVLVENLRKSEKFDITEDSHFKTTGVMLDTSGYHIITVKGMKKLLDYLAVMGYNMAMLYTEDTVKIESRKYLGYLRGRYSLEELREIDDYAYEYGIEMIPCIECYGHMQKYLVWPEAAPIKDTNSILLAREPKTFEFLDEFISTLASCFRSKRIHIGMDEAHEMGRGKFLEKHGLIDKNIIFDEFMESLCKIAEKHGLIPMMWSDMYFRNNSKRRWYYDVNAVIPESVKTRIPKNVELVFWHYGEEPYCDDEMLKKHIELERNVLFAAGTWCWAGHLPECNYAYSTVKFSLDACRKNGVKEMMTTVWTKGDSDWFSNLLPLSFTAELNYDKNPDKNKLKDRFEAVTGGDFNAFWDMSLYHNKFDNTEEFEGGYNYAKRFFGQALFWQDILSGKYDALLYERPMSAHYKTSADAYSKYITGGKWDYLYKHVKNLFEYLAVKCEIAEKIAPAYKANDKNTLKQIAEKLLPSLIEKTKTVHKSHKDVWFRDNKSSNFASIDIRYGGVCARAETAIMLINGYLEGKIDKIEELAEERLPISISGFMSFMKVSTPSQVI